MNRGLNRLYGSITRKEILTEDIEMHSKDNLKKVVEKGEVLDAVYLYEVLPVSKRTDFSQQEIVDFENIINVLFIKYGEKCLEEKFLLGKIQQELAESKVVDLFVMSVAKFYKGEFRRGRMGILEMNSRMITLTRSNDNIDTI